LLRNTSEANSIINNGLDLAAEDEVLAWEENHPTNRHSWRYRAQRHRFTYRELALPATLSDEEIVQQFKDSLTRKTRVVTFSHLSNVSGRLLPAQAICEMVHKFDPSIWVHIDGAQSWGSVALDLPALGCDSFSSSGHKWLMGPRATGILYVRSGRATEVWPATLGYDFTLSYPEDSLPENAQRFELLGQRDPAPFAALTAAVETQHSLGGSLAVQNRIAELTRYTREAATAAGLQCLGPANAHGVTVIDLNNAIKAYGAFIALHNEGIAAAFVNGSRICCEPEQGMPESGPVYVRLSPHLYNSVQEIDQAIATIRRINESPLHIVKELLRFI
jgi:cysteine desulfurase/selenocysteine lyase